MDSTLPVPLEIRSGQHRLGTIEIAWPIDIGKPYLVDDGRKYVPVSVGELDLRAALLEALKEDDAR